MSLFNIGTKAMSASYAALQTTGHNISNAGTKGYSRQQVEVATAGGSFTGAGFFGRGVDVQTVTRARDDFLAREVVGAHSAAGADQARASQLQRLENVFPTGEAGIGYKAGALLNAFADVATRPQDTTARQVVLSRAGDLASAFTAAGQDLEALQAGVNEDLKTAAGQLTGLAARVAEINRSITANQGLGHQQNDLLDQRDELIRQISKLVGVSTVASGDGAVNLFIGGGQILVLGSESSQISTISGEYDPARTRLSITDPNGKRALPDGLISGGTIGGLMQFQNDDLVAARTQLGQMAAALTQRLNGQQALGIDLTLGNGQPLLSVGGPTVRPSASNAKDASGFDLASYIDANGARQPSVAMTVVDATRVQAGEYVLGAAPSGVAGDYSLTRQPGGTPVTVRSGDVVDGMRIDIVGPPPGPTDRFLLQPVTSAALNARLEMNDPRGIAAASPVIATAGTANTGTVTSSSLRPTALDAAQPATSFRITFGATNPDGTMEFDWQQLDAGGNVVASTPPPPAAPPRWTPGTAIDSSTFATPQRVQWQMQLAGTPRAGDSLTVAPVTAPGPNNGNAEAMLALRDERLVGRDGTVAGGVLTGASITDAYARAIADIGLRVQTAKTAATTSGAVAQQSLTDLQARTGVNLDEEAARLMQFQQSYQAAAKVLQVAQSVMDILLSTTTNR